MYGKRDLNPHTMELVAGVLNSNVISTEKLFELFLLKYSSKKYLKEMPLPICGAVCLLLQNLFP
jgi:hypothetical protein